jgi:hypothetical protein
MFLLAVFFWIANKCDTIFIFIFVGNDQEGRDYFFTSKSVGKPMKLHDKKKNNFFQF